MRWVFVAEFSQLLQRPLGATVAAEMLHDRPGRLEGIRSDIGRLCHTIGGRVARYGDMCNVAQSQPRIRKQPPDGIRREGEAVLLAIADALFRNGTDHLTIHDQAGG
ncbi:hypothetical protein BA898_06090 [Spiribacter roseus]|nr:hypothetical protein [Spiribacter roseus]KAF0284753.1 hypothetical protein BA898_06090 [Spiribacter roseus]